MFICSHAQEWKWEGLVIEVGREVWPLLPFVWAPWQPACQSVPLFAKLLSNASLAAAQERVNIVIVSKYV